MYNKKLCIFEWAFGVRYLERGQLFVVCDNIILRNRWKVQKFINPICYYGIDGFNGEELHKPYSLYKREGGTPRSFFSQCAGC